ncbi:MAG: hypothetical protein HFI66_11990 [Lachnospiraceae bacterium]|jgi:hypothetical protein|nr:hypothetical protein [Lachnospiraceae bacterium]
MIIDERMLADHGARIKGDYTISGVPLNTHYHQGVRQSGFTLHSQEPGLKMIELTVLFFGKDRPEIDQRKSLFDGMLFGKNELCLDGYFYTVFCSSIGGSLYQGECLCESTYQFTGYKHGRLKKVTGNTLYCESTLPYTDCRVSVAASKAASSYRVGGITYRNVKAGEKLVADGICKRILINGTPAADRAEWFRFPTLVPGKNIILCDDTVTVEYYPVYF